MVKTQSSNSLTSLVDNFVKVSHSWLTFTVSILYRSFCQKLDSQKLFEALYGCKRMAYSFSDQDAQRVAEVYSKLNGGLDGDAHKLTRTDLQKTLEILVLVEQREDVNTFLDERTNLHRKNGEYTSMQILEYFGKDDFQTYFEWRKEQQASSI